MVENVKIRHCISGIWRCRWMLDAAHRTCCGCGSMNATLYMVPVWSTKSTRTDMLPHSGPQWGKTSSTKTRYRKYKTPRWRENHTYVTTDEFDHQICLSFSKAPDCVYCALKNKPGFQTNPNCDMISLTWTSKSIVVIISHLCLFAFRAYNEE